MKGDLRPRHRYRIPIFVCLASAAAPGLVVPTTFADSPRQDQPPTVLVDFEDAPSGRSGTPVQEFDDLYEDLGIVFEFPVTALVFDGESIPALEDFARSGSTVVTDCYSQEFCSNRIVVSIPRRPQTVSLWIGSIRSIDEQASVVLEGLDERRQLVDVDVATLGPSDGPIPVRTPLRLVDEGARIATIEVRWEDETSFRSDLAIDDLELIPLIVPDTTTSTATTEPRDDDTRNRTEPTEPSVETTIRATSAPSIVDDEDGSTPPTWLVLIAIAGLALVVGSLVARRLWHRPPRVRLIPRADAGTQRVQPTRRPGVLIRGAFYPGDGTTTIEDLGEPRP